MARGIKGKKSVISKAGKRALTSSVGSGKSGVFSEDLEERIRMRAYFLSLERGFSSSPQENWLAAEQDVKLQRQLT